MNALRPHSASRQAYCTLCQRASAVPRRRAGRAAGSCGAAAPRTRTSHAGHAVAVWSSVSTCTTALPSPTRSNLADPDSAQREQDRRSFRSHSWPSAVRSKAPPASAVSGPARGEDPRGADLQRTDSSARRGVRDRARAVTRPHPSVSCRPVGSRSMHRLLGVGPGRFDTGMMSS